MGKQLVYSEDISINDLFVGLQSVTLVISGRVYKNTRKFLGWDLKPKYTYTLNVPYVEKPYFDGEYGTNKILRAKSEILKQALLDKIAEFEEEDK